MLVTDRGILEGRGAWLLFPGVLCLLIGISFPTSKLYHQSLALLLWVPGLVLFWSCRAEIRPMLRTALGATLLAFILWSVLTLFWSSADDPLRQFKHVLYVVVSLWGMRLLGLFPAPSLERMLRGCAYFMALLASAYWIRTYWVEDAPWLHRVTGSWQLEHSILAAHVFGFFMVVLYQLKPAERKGMVPWALALLALALYLVFAQSKGVWVALVAVILLTPLWKRERIYLVLSILCLAGVVGALWYAPELALQRGFSYRPELLREGFGLLLDGSPLAGLGLGSLFKLQLSSIATTFDHPHNLYLGIALQLGLIGLLFWSLAWLSMGTLAWRMRERPLGSVLLGVWLFASLALLSDGAGPWVKPQEIWFLTWIPFGLALALGRLADAGHQSFSHTPR